MNKYSRINHIVRLLNISISKISGAMRNVALVNADRRQTVITLSGEVDYPPYKLAIHRKPMQIHNTGGIAPGPDDVLSIPLKGNNEV